jgi:DNA-binding NtrC family response regulator
LNYCSRGAPTPFRCPVKRRVPPTGRHPYSVRSFVIRYSSLRATARTLIAETKPHLALLDLKLSRDDGLVLLRELRWLQPTLRVVEGGKKSQALGFETLIAFSAVDPGAWYYFITDMPVISFKVTDAEARAIREKVRTTRAKSVSALLRQSVLGGDPRPAKIIRRKHPVSGLSYNAAPGRIVTAEEIRAALADFP